MEKTKQIPNWVLGRDGVDEVNFCREFLYTHNMICVDGTFYGYEGRIWDEGQLRYEIYQTLCPYISCGLARKVEALLGALRLEARKTDLALKPSILHLANGTLELGGEFRTDKDFCRYRLPVSYNPNAPKPVRWLSFLDELLEPTDILTLQEYMGYCLIPTTKGQKMLIITGNGGEGKSRIGVVMKALLGCNMNTGSIAKVESSPFARADLEHILLLVDDDLKMEALNQTNYLKSIITAELPMDLERKGIQSYQGQLHARFMAFGNGTLQALHDRSYGFFRRQIILSAKPRDPNRVDDPYLGELLKQEVEGIFLWALVGLNRLVERDFQFTISDHALENMRQSMAEGNNIVEFLQSDGYFRFDPQGSATSRALYNAYRDWCDDNNLMPLAPKTFAGYLKQNAAEYALAYTTNVPIGNGRHARGFQGIRMCSRF